LEITEKFAFPKTRRWKNHERKGRWIKYAVLAAIICAGLLSLNLAYFLDPISFFTRISTYAFYPVTILIINAVLDLVRPILETLGWMGAARISLHQPMFSGSAIIVLALFIVAFSLGALQNRFYCRSICPLGALLAIAARFTPLRRIVGPECDKDLRCRRICPSGSICEDPLHYDPSECLFCQDCISLCHLSCTAFKLGPPNPSEANTDLTRRRFVAGASAGGIIGVSIIISPSRRVLSDDLLRPPGALPEPQFLGSCVRCGQCIKSCITSTLQPSFLEGGLEGLWTPKHLMRLGFCMPDCTLCGKVCPTGAIRELSLEEKRFAKIGNAVIDRSRCIVWEQDFSCLACDEVCPYGAIYWIEEKGVRRPYVDEKRCNGCGHCESICPIDGASAIRVKPSGQIRLASGSYIKEAATRGLIIEPRQDIGPKDPTKVNGEG